MTDQKGASAQKDKPSNCGLQESKRLDEERKYLEDLLTRRFNFFLAFAGAVAAALTTVRSEKWVPALMLLAAIVSLLFWRALFRTYILVREILELTEKHEDHPLSIARNMVRKKGYTIRQSDHYIAQWIPGLITVAFFAAAAGTAIYHWTCITKFGAIVSVVIVVILGFVSIYLLDVIDARKAQRFPFYR